MKFEYTGRHIEVTSALRSHVESHFDKLKDLFDGDNAKAHIIIEVEKNRHRSEIVIKWRKDVLTANTTVSDMYQSLSQTIDKIEKQARRLKTKIIDKHHKAKKVTTVAEPTEDVAPVADSPRIITTRRYSVKPLTDEEAILQLTEEENQFLVFRSADDERISIIYKEKTETTD